MSRETVFCQKVVTAFPIPFRILGSSQIQKRTDPRQDKDKFSGEGAGKENSSHAFTEAKKNSGTEDSENQTVLDGILQRPGNLSLASGGLCLRDCGQQHHGDRVGDGRGKKHQRERHSGKHAVDAER